MLMSRNAIALSYRSRHLNGCYLAQGFAGGEVKSKLRTDGPMTVADFSKIGRVGRGGTDFGKMICYSMSVVVPTVLSKQEQRQIERLHPHTNLICYFVSLPNELLCPRVFL